MFLSPTSEIRVEAAGNDVSYLLPSRPLGKLRRFGLIPVAFSLLFISIPLKSLIEFLQRIAAGEGGIGNWFFVLFLSVFIVAGLTPLWLGLLAIYGRCRMDWRERRLSVTDYAGPIPVSYTHLTMPGRYVGAAVCHAGPSASSPSPPAA